MARIGGARIAHLAQDRQHRMHRGFNPVGNSATARLHKCDSPASPPLSESLFRNSASVRGWGDVVTRLREVEWSGPMGFQGVAETLWRSPCGPRPPVSSIVELPPVTKPI